MKKKLPDAHIRWTIQFILNHKKANMWRKEKLNIEKKNNRTKNPPISTQVIQKNLPFPSTLISKNQKKKINQQTWKNTKTLWKKWKKACFSLCIKHILKEKTKNENKENISINWRIKQPKERKKKTILHVKRKKNIESKKIFSWMTWVLSNICFYLQHIIPWLTKNKEMLSKNIVSLNVDVIRMNVGIFNLLLQLEKMLHKAKNLLAHSGANVHLKSVVCTVLDPVDLYLISEKSIWKNQVRQTGFLVYFELDFYCLCSLQKSILKLIFAG